MSLSCSDSASAFFAAEFFSAGLPAGASAEAGLFEASADGDGEVAPTAFFNSSSLRFFFSCLAKSSAFASLVNAIDFPSGDQTGLPVPFGKSVNENESPPASGNIDN